MEQGRIGMIHLPSRRTDGSSLSSYRYSHPPPPPTRNSMNQPSSLLGVLNIGPAPCFSAGLGYYHPLKTRPAFFDPPQVDESEPASRPIPVSLAPFQPVFHSVPDGKEQSGKLRTAAAREPSGQSRSQMFHSSISGTR